ncbi:ABC transporter [Plasmodium cynomolgi strain B]|uniref:ABC transporter n=1 Tax=Plasmodium cynomolgi (strain B) TaxID=1120755 RepID=K6UVK2_PLACD|nr:ABC transporter [Plasmodium cynomolgi strain B]GAB67549.1 ABC transporter [Plasmodium cynomolgi strain B]
MQSYKCFRKNARLPQHFFCQHVSTLNKKNHLISCEDEKRTRKIAEHVYATLVASHHTNHNCQKNAQNEPTPSSLKRIISSYLLRKIKKIKKAQNSTGTEVAKESTPLVHGLPGSRSYAAASPHCLQRRFYHPQKYLPKNGPTLNNAHHHFSYTRSSRKKGGAPNNISPCAPNRNTRDDKNEEHHREVVHSRKYAKCNDVVHPTYYPLQRGITNKCLHLYVPLKWFGTNVGKESQGERAAFRDKAEKEGAESEWGAYRSDHTASSSPAASSNPTESSNPTANGNPAANGSHGGERPDAPHEEYEKLKIKELEKILNTLEKINENKNSKINVNIKILVVSLVTCLNMFLYIVFTTLVTKRRTIIRKFMNKSEQNTFNIFLDSIQNVEQVKYYTNEMHELKKFIKEQKKYEREAINVQKSLSLLNFGQQIILNFNLFLCLYLTYINIANDVFPFSYLILVNTLLFQLAMPLNMFGTIYRETKLSLVDIECMIKILVKKIQSLDYSSKLEIQTGNIKFENVSFKYPLMEEKNDSELRTSEGDNQNGVPTKSISKFSQLFKTMRDKFFFPKKWLNSGEQPIPPMSEEIKNNLKNALRESIQTTSLTSTTNEPKRDTNQKENNYIFQNFTCNIENGEKVAIIGKSGLGKSTLIKLLLKFYEINSGNIYIDNKNIENINLYTLRKNISVVPQDTILFNNTISYNIKYGNFQCTDKQMIDACVQSELHEKILQMDKQYDTLVGERGTKLSIGEKQRICIARCFLKNSKIIVLDEHASNLDNENKKSIEKALHKLCLGKTTFVITHLMENLQTMDKIIFFSGNNIFVGSHNELMIANPSYREFLNSRNNQLL